MAFAVRSPVKGNGALMSLSPWITRVGVLIAARSDRKPVRPTRRARLDRLRAPAGRFGCQRWWSLIEGSKS